MPSITALTELSEIDGRAIGCPAAPMVAGELRRRGVPAMTGSPPLEGRTATVFATVAAGDREPVGLGVAVPAVARHLTREAGRVLADWLSVMGPRSVRLAGLGAVFVDDLDEVPRGATVVFSAHGVSPAVRTHAGERGLSVVDATCPLVAKVHAEARRFAARGDTVVLVGHADHEEVEGTRVEDPARISYLTQTTLAVDETADVGSANSSNSVRLVELSRRHGTPVYLVDDASDLRPEWLAGVRTVGVTAGASAPDRLVGGVVAALRGLGPVEVTERTTARETIRFGLPSAVGAS